LIAKVAFVFIIISFYLLPSFSSIKLFFFTPPLIVAYQLFSFPFPFTVVLAALLFFCFIAFIFKFFIFIFFVLLLNFFFVILLVVLYSATIVFSIPLFLLPNAK